jgi:Tol biopolymer transport system component
MWRETDLGYTYPQPVKWSQDGGYFYFTNTPVVEGCKALPVNGSDLQRVDLKTGDIREILPNIAFWISLSPDESLLAYIKQVSSNLWVRNLNTGEEKEINIDPGLDFDAGNIVWSPNGQLLALTLANQPCTGNYPGSGIYAESTSILIVDISTFEVKKIAEGDKRRLVTSAWNEIDKIELKDPEGNLWILNVKTGAINQ